MLTYLLGVGVGQLGGCRFLENEIKRNVESNPRALAGLDYAFETPVDASDPLLNIE